MAVKRTVNRGTTYSITYQHQHDGVDEPLTGATVYFTAKSVEYDNDDADSTAVISKDVTSHTDAAAGLTTITLTPADTYIDPGDYHYDLVVKEASGAVYQIDEGILVIDGGPTNRAAA